MGTDIGWLTLLSENRKERYMVELSIEDTFDYFLQRIEAMHPRDPSIDLMEYELKVLSDQIDSAPTRVIPWDRKGETLAELGLGGGSVVILARPNNYVAPPERPALPRSRSDGL
jgi:hypothetical protein